MWAPVGDSVLEVVVHRWALLGGAVLATHEAALIQVVLCNNRTLQFSPTRVAQQREAPQMYQSVLSIVEVLLDTNECSRSVSAVAHLAPTLEALAHVILGNANGVDQLNVGEPGHATYHFRHNPLFPTQLVSLRAPAAT